jgi:PhnB protein
VTRIWPQLSVRRGREAVDWYIEAFGAAVDYRVGGDDEMEAVVAQLSVGDAVFWVSDESPEHENLSPESIGGSTTRMALLVDDPVAVLARAVSAGAREVWPVSEEYGWLLGRIEDPYGHHWEIGKPPAGWPRAD